MVQENNFLIFSYWTPYRGIDTLLTYFTYHVYYDVYWTPYRGIDTLPKWTYYLRCIRYWTPYRGIEMLIRFPWKGSGEGVVYGCGVWRVKSWVKNVPNTNKYIAIFSIKWGWSPLTYLPLVVIIFEKSIILFYWTPYRGIDNFYSIMQHVFFVKAIEPLIGGLRPNRKGTAPQSVRYWTPYRGIDTYSTLDDRFWHRSTLCLCHYWTPYRGIDTISSSASAASSPLLNPL